MANTRSNSTRNRQEARIVAMETDAYVRRYPTSVDSILQAA